MTTHSETETDVGAGSEMPPPPARYRSKRRSKTPPSRTGPEDTTDTQDEGDSTSSDTRQGPSVLPRRSPRKHRKRKSEAEDSADSGSPRKSVRQTTTKSASKSKDLHISIIYVTSFIFFRHKFPFLNVLLFHIKPCNVYFCHKFIIL